jgi:hypothetical protein
MGHERLWALRTVTASTRHTGVSMLQLQAKSGKGRQGDVAVASVMWTPQQSDRWGIQE